jgi:hypothetical protein
MAATARLRLMRDMVASLDVRQRPTRAPLKVFDLGDRQAYLAAVWSLCLISDRWGIACRAPAGSPQLRRSPTGDGVGTFRGLACLIERPAMASLGHHRLAEPPRVRWRLRCFGFRDNYSVTIAS